MAEKVLKEGHDDIVKAEKELDGIVGEIVGDISKAIHKNEKKEKEAPVEQRVVESVATEETIVIETPIVEMAPPVVKEPVIEEPVEEPII